MIFFKKMNKAYLDTFNLSDRHLQHLIFMMSIMKKKWIVRCVIPSQNVFNPIHPN